MRTIICQRCGQQYSLQDCGGRPKYCPDCGRIVHKEQVDKWKLEHPVPKKLRDLSLRKCVVCGREYAPVSDLQQYCCAECRNVVNKESARQHGIGRKYPHQPKRREKRICPQCGREYRTRLNDQAFCPACIAEARALSLGRFPPPRTAWRSEYVPIPLNQPFPNCEGHHIDKTHIVYIPKELHRSVRHDLWGNKNMVRINALALEYLQRKP